MKFSTLVATPSDMSKDEFATWFVGEHVPKIRQSAPLFQGCLVRTCIDPLQGQGLAGVGWTGPTPSPSEIAPCDILMEIWLPSGEDFRREILPSEERLEGIGATFSSYAVTPRLEKDPRVSEAGPSGKRPELTFISTVKWSPSMPPEIAAKNWAEHAAIALRRQTILTKYEQNIVSEVISWSDGSPTLDAYGDFSFATIDDLLNKFRVSNEEIQDAGQFVHLSGVTFFGDPVTFGPR